MSDFWLSSGHHLLDRDAHGRLAVADDLLKAYLARPEVVPPDDACLVEKAVHQRLMRNPRETIEPGEIGAIADRDARENWRYLLGFRDHLVRHGTVEAAYLAYARAKAISVPPMFLNQLVHLSLRNMLDGETDAFVLRAAEMLFRPQRLSLNDGIILLADEETVDGAATDHTSPLIAVFGDARARSLDVLSAANAPAYFERSDRFDMVLDFRPREPGRRALATVLERWVRSFLGVDVTISPVDQVVEQSWTWFVGLDQEATAIGNALWSGEEPKDSGRERIVALFELRFQRAEDALEAVAGKPVTLILAMTANRIVRMKPQNLLAGLPLRVAQS